MAKQQLTRTELETLAVMLDSSTRKMSRTPEAWPYRIIDDAVGEIFDGYYDLQCRHAPANLRVYI
jgi:hypothetical protein